jgi:hypothetical protein
LPPLTALWARCRHVRHDVLGMTRQQLSAALSAMAVSDTSPSSVRRYEADPAKSPGFARVPRVDYLRALADLAGVPPSWLLVGATPGDPPASRRVESARRRIESEIQGLVSSSARSRDPNAESVDDPQAVFAEIDRRYRQRLRDGDIDEVTWQCWLAFREGAILGGAYRPPRDSDEGQRSERSTL